MKIINQIFEFFEQLNSRQLIQFMSAILALLSIISGIIIYKHYSNSSALVKQINFVNSMRDETKELLIRNLAVKKQQEKVADPLGGGKEKSQKLLSEIIAIQAKIDEITGKSAEARALLLMECLIRPNSIYIIL